MLPVTAGLDATKLQIFIYSFLLLLLSIAPFFFGYLGYFYLTSAFILGLYYVYRSIRLWKPEASKESMKLFGYSILYLFALFTLMAVDRVWEGAL